MRLRILTSVCLVSALSAAPALAAPVTVAYIVSAPFVGGGGDLSAFLLPDSDHISAGFQGSVEIELLPEDVASSDPNIGVFNGRGDLTGLVIGVTQQFQFRWSGPASFHVNVAEQAMGLILFAPDGTIAAFQFMEPFFADVPSNDSVTNVFRLDQWPGRVDMDFSTSTYNLFTDCCVEFIRVPVPEPELVSPALTCCLLAMLSGWRGQRRRAEG